MAIQAVRGISPGLEFPAQGAEGKKPIVPFTISELLTNSDLSVCGGVCKVWQRFVQSVTSARSAQLTAEGIRLPAEEVLRATIRSYPELKVKIQQFFRNLDPSRHSELDCFRSDGQQLLSIRIRPKTGTPPLHEETVSRYIMTHLPPSSVAVSSMIHCTDQRVHSPLIIHQYDSFDVHGWQRGGYGIPGEYNSSVTVFGSLPLLQQDAPDVEKVTQIAQRKLESFNRVLLKLEKRLPELCLYLPPDIQSSIEEMIKFCADLQYASEISVPCSSLFLGSLEADLVLEWIETISEGIDVILKEPALCKRLKKLGEDLLPVLQSGEMQQYLHKFKSCLQEAAKSRNLQAMEQAFEIVPFTPADLDLLQTRDHLKSLVEPLFIELYEAIRPTLDEHFAQKQVEEADDRKQPVIESPGPDDYSPIQEFVDVAKQAALERQSALNKELSFLQARGVEYVDFIQTRVNMYRDEFESQPARYTVAFLAAFAGTMFTLYRRYGH